MRHVLAGFSPIPTDARVVRDRNRITGAGVSAGLDFGLTVVAELRDRVNAECCPHERVRPRPTIQFRLDEDCSPGGERTHGPIACRLREEV